MSAEWTLQGGLIYAATAALLVAFALSWHRRRAGWAAYAAGFAVCLAAVGWRWFDAGHAPLQRMYEVFLVMAMLMFPLTLACRRAWGIDGERWDMLLAAGLLVPAGFVLSPAPHPLPPALQSPLFIPHVLAYLAAYVLVGKAAIQSIRQLAHGQGGEAARLEGDAWRLVLLAMGPMTVGLALGSLWGKFAWGRFWNWDPKEMWGLATWLLLLGYLHFRALHGRRYPRLNAAWVLVVLGAVLFTLLGVSYLLEGLHSYAT